MLTTVPPMNAVVLSVIVYFLLFVWFLISCIKGAACSKKDKKLHESFIAGGLFVCPKGKIHEVTIIDEFGYNIPREYTGTHENDLGV